MKSNETAKSQPLGIGSIIGKVANLRNVDLKEKLQTSKDNIQKTSLRLKENLSNTFQKKAEETAEFIDSVKHKNTKVKNLENLLDLDKSLLLSSDKTTSFYKHSKDRIIIVEKDILENPCAVTLKEGSKVSVFLVKYTEYTPYLYPTYDERDIPGSIIYMDSEQIWYRDMDKLTLGYNNGSTMEFTTVKLSELLGFTETDLVSYIKKYFVIIRSAKLSKLQKEKPLTVNNIIKLTDNYVICKNNEGYTIYIYNYSMLSFDELNLKHLPKININSFDTLLSSDILKFIKDNNYPIEDFEEKGGYIEYNREVGRKKISVMRFKL
jgi:hypothetical protein